MNISIEDLIAALRSLKTQTGSISCLGCGHEHNCSTSGCALIREAADQLERLTDFSNSQIADLLKKNGALQTAMVAISNAALSYIECGPYNDEGKTAALFANSVDDLSAVFVYGDDAKAWQQPLTREQLRNMVGSWVWVVVNYENAEAAYKCDGWAKIVTYGTVAYFDQSLKVSELGTRFEAYAQPVSNFGVRLLYREGIKVDAKTK